MVKELQDELRRSGDGVTDCTEIIQNMISAQHIAEKRGELDVRKN